MSYAMRIAAVTAAMSLSGAFATANAQTFFGQDLRWGLGATSVVGTNSVAARTSFLSNLTGVATENFESFAVGAGAPLPLTFAGAGTATLSNKGEVLNTPGAGRRATSGSKFWELGTGSGGSQFTVKFSQAIAAFGVYGVDVGDFGDQLTMQFFNNNVAAGSWSPLHGLGGGGGGANDGNLNFFGYINTNNLFDEIRFSSVGTTNQSQDFWGFDDMTIGSLQQVSTVPEPSSVALMATGLIGVLIARRRHRGSASK